MKIKNRLSIHRLIGKIDNDFNISESDWVPRVAAWVTDALSQMQCLPMERKRRFVEVNDRLATFPCTLNATDIKIYNKNGCEIRHASNNNSCGSHSIPRLTPQEIAVLDDSNKTGINFMEVAQISCNCEHNFVIEGNTIELNFDTDYIIVESYETATYYDEYYECDVPYIYDDGLLLEALAWYCLYKYLSRGSKHQVYDLKSPSPVINPYVQWNTLRPKASASVKIALNNSEGWNNFFYNSTFRPRD